MQLVCGTKRLCVAKDAQSPSFGIFLAGPETQCHNPQELAAAVARREPVQFITVEGSTVKVKHES
jgi:hypothetical protein